MIADRLLDSLLVAAATGRLIHHPDRTTFADASGAIPTAPSIQIPHHWKVRQLSELTSYVQRGKSPKYCDKSPYLAVSQKCVQWSGFESEKARPYHPEAFQALPEHRLLRNGDLLWNSTGTGTLGRSLVLTERDTSGAVMAADSHVTVIRCTAELLPEFLHLWIRSPLVQGFLTELSSGTTKQKELNRGTILRLCVPVPPTDEQEAIVQWMRTVAPLIDQLAELEREREDLDTRFASAIGVAIQAAAMAGRLTGRQRNNSPSDLSSRLSVAREQTRVRGKQSRGKAPERTPEPFVLPEGWFWETLGRLIGYSGSGSTPKGGRSVYVEQGMMFLRSQNVHNDGLRLDNVVFISEDTVKTLGKNQVRSGDLLLNITGASIGRCALVPDDFAGAKTNQHILTMRPLLPEMGNFLHYAVTAPYVQEQIMAAQFGATKEGLNSQAARGLLVAVPPLPEQDAICQILESTAPCISVIRNAVVLR